MLGNCTKGWDPTMTNTTSPYFKQEYNTSFYELFVMPLKGYYSSYDINGDGEWIDIWKDTANTTIDDFISYRNNKCIYFSYIVISLTMNLYLPYTGTYLNVLFGIEMLQYYDMIKYQFITNHIVIAAPDDLVILLIYVLFSTSVFLSIIKLIYEMNLKMNITIQLLTLFGDLVNVAIIIFVTL
jgi:hypothetical protein